MYMFTMWMAVASQQTPAKIPLRHEALNVTRTHVAHKALIGTGEWMVESCVGCTAHLRQGNRQMMTCKLFIQLLFNQRVAPMHKTRD
jgi:hypothetical protein